MTATDPTVSATPTPAEATDVSSLDRARKVAMLSGHDEWHLEAVPELGLPGIMVADGPHGVRKVPGGGLLDAMASLPATCYPTASATGASWDRELLGEIGRALAAEARSQDVAVLLGPGVNIKRHPACGRNFEYFSEDPLLAGELAAAFIDGVQSLGIGTSLKHYAVNNQESHRMEVDAVVDERTLRELYLPAFEIAVTRAQPWTIMVAYNRVNGTYCCEHPWLLDEVLRREWGFTGLVVSDWGANDDRVAAVAAGMDLEMPGGASAHDAAVLAAVESGALPEAALDACVARVAQLQQRAVDAAGAPDGDVARFDPDAAHALARRAAAASAVLLTNPVGALPLAAGGRVAVVGRFAAEPRFQGSGSSRVNASRVDAPLEEIRRRVTAAGGEVVFADGYDDAGDADPGTIAAAVAATEGADVVVAVVGLPGTFEAEGADRAHLRLPAGHDELVWALTAAHPNVVVVLIAGSAVELPWIDEAAAVLLTHLGGQAVGSAVADVLYGDAEPGGRLAETFFRRRTDVPADRWFPGHPRQVQYREGLLVGYRWSETAGVDVLFPFGHGLSYTSFALGDATLSSPVFDARATDDGAPATSPDVGVEVSVPVANTGDRAGSTVVQVYVRALDAVVDRPDRELRGFAKVHLDAGASTTVTVALGRRAFAHWDTGRDDWVVCSGRYEVLVATSARDIHATLPLEVAGDLEPPVDGPTRRWRPAADGGIHVTDDQFAALLGGPVPAPDPLRPFTRNSTVGDLGETLLGRLPVALVRRIVSTVVRRSSGDGGLAVTVDQGLRELPLRNLSIIPGGPSSGAVEGLVRTANRLAALGRLPRSRR